MNGLGNIELRGQRSYLFDFEKPDALQIKEAVGDVVLINDFNNNELRALIYLNGFSKTQATKCILSCSPPLKKL